MPRALSLPLSWNATRRTVRRGLTRVPTENQNSGRRNTPTVPPCPLCVPEVVRRTTIINILCERSEVPDSGPHRKAPRRTYRSLGRSSVLRTRGAASGDQPVRTRKAQATHVRNKGHIHWRRGHPCHTVTRDPFGCRVGTGSLGTSMLLPWDLGTGFTRN